MMPFWPRHSVYLLTLATVLAAPLGAAGQKSTLSDKDRRLAEQYFIDGLRYSIQEDYAKAYMLLNQSLEINPEEPATNYELAKILHARGNTDRAMYHAKFAQKAATGNKYYHQLVSELHLSNGNLAAAADNHKLMLEQAEVESASYFELAAIYLYSDRPEDALEVYDRVEDKFGYSEQVGSQRLEIYRQLDKPKQAEKEAQRLVQSLPEAYQYRVVMAQIYLDEGKPKAALEAVEGLFPIDWQASKKMVEVEAYRQLQDVKRFRQSLAEVFADVNVSIQDKLPLFAPVVEALPDYGDPDHAWLLANNLLEAHPSEANSHAAAGDLAIKLNQKDKALGHYLQAMELDKSSLQLWMNVLNIYLEKKEHERVVVLAEESLEYFPNQGLLYYFLGTGHFLAKDYPSAIRAYEQGRRVAGDNPHLKVVLLTQLGDTYHQLGDHESSDKAYDQVLQIRPNDPHVLNNYSYYLAQRGERLKQALRMSATLLSQFPNDLTYVDTHAWVLYAMGRYEAARQAMEKGLAASDKAPKASVLEHYGDILFQLGEVELAVEQWRKALQASGTSSPSLKRKINERQL